MALRLKIWRLIFYTLDKWISYYIFKVIYHYIEYMLYIQTIKLLFFEKLFKMF